MKKIYFIFCGVLLLGAGCGLPVNKVPQDTTTATATAETLPEGAVAIYYATGCSHCEVVLGYIKQIRADQKLNIILKESYNDQDNYNELMQRVKICGIPLYQVGVPLLWDGKTCYRGDANIKAYLDARMKK